MLQSRRAWMAESCSGSKLTKNPPRASARCAKRKKRYEVCRRRESHLKQSRRPKRPTDLSHGYSTVQQRVWHTHVDKSLERPVQHEAFFSSSSASPAIPCTSIVHGLILCPVTFYHVLDCICSLPREKEGERKISKGHGTQTALDMSQQMHIFSNRYSIGYSSNCGKKAPEQRAVWRTPVPTRHGEIGICRGSPDIGGVARNQGDRGGGRKEEYSSVN